MGNIVIELNAQKCKACHLCVSVCPKKVLVPGKNTLNQSGYRAVETDNANACIGCVSCALMCPEGAISLYNRP
jgi:2-oxoglutarate ferredoxin oxidoreductase subunit delta